MKFFQSSDFSFSYSSVYNIFIINACTVYNSPDIIFANTLPLFTNLKFGVPSLSIPNYSAKLYPFVSRSIVPHYKFPSYTYTILPYYS